jgi:hypothetical protein
MSRKTADKTADGVKPLMIRPAHVFTFLFLFWALWVYSELDERGTQGNFYAEAQEFMSAGGRFTTEDGAALEKRIEALEKTIKEKSDE